MIIITHQWLPVAEDCRVPKTVDVMVEVRSRQNRPLVTCCNEKQTDRNVPADLLLATLQQLFVLVSIHEENNSLKWSYTETGREQLASSTFCQKNRTENKANSWMWGWKWELLGHITVTAVHHLHSAQCSASHHGLPEETTVRAPRSQADAALWCCNRCTAANVAHRPSKQRFITTPSTGVRTADGP